MSCDPKESFSFTLPIATSSPHSTNTSLEKTLEREIADHRRKSEDLKLQVMRNCQLMLANIEDGFHYVIIDEENHPGSILRKSERSTKKTKSGLNKNSAQCVRFVLNSNSSVGTANYVESPIHLKEDKTKFAGIEDPLDHILEEKGNGQPTVIKRSQPGRNVKRTNSQISKISTQSGSTFSGKTSSKSSALREDKITDTRNMTPVKTINYKIASVTPKPNVKSSTAILRKPKPGEMVISMTGSPLLVSSVQGSTQMPQLSIPIDEERILTVLGKESLDANNFPSMDSVTKARLAKLHNFLGQVLDDEN